MNQLIIDKPVYRTAPATPGLLKTASLARNGAILLVQSRLLLDILELVTEPLESLHQPLPTGGTGGLDEPAQHTLLWVSQN